MPQRYSGLKELRKSHRRHMQNLDIKTEIKKTIKDFLASVEGKDKAKAQEKLKTVYKKLDKATKRNILHKNTVSRRKSFFAKQLAKIS